VAVPSFVQVLPSAELAEEALGDTGIRRVRVNGAAVLLGRLPHVGVVAFAAICPHEQTDMEEGARFVDGKVRCPLHFYLYDARTGENVYPAREADPAEMWKLKPGYLRVYPVEERDGWIWVGTEPEPAPAAYDPDLEQPPSRTEPPVAEPLAAARPAAGPTEHPTKTLRVAPGATFTLRLPTTPRPGFVWRVETDGPLLRVVEERFEHGDPPRHLVRVNARGTGEATLRCLYARPWDTKAAETRIYKIRIEFS